MKPCENNDRPALPHLHAHQYEVSILRGSIFGREFEDVPLLNELISGVNDILFSSEQFVHLQQLSHALLGYTHTKHGCQSFYCQLYTSHKMCTQRHIFQPHWITADTVAIEPLNHWCDFRAIINANSTELSPRVKWEKNGWPCCSLHRGTAVTWSNAN